MRVPLRSRRASLPCTVFALLFAFVACADSPDALDEDEHEVLAREAAGELAPEAAAREPAPEGELATVPSEAELLAELLHELEMLYADSDARAPSTDDARDAELDGDTVEFARELAEQLEEEDPRARDDHDASSLELVVQ